MVSSHWYMCTTDWQVLVCAKASSIIRSLAHFCLMHQKPFCATSKVAYMKENLKWFYWKIPVFVQPSQMSQKLIETLLMMDLSTIAKSSYESFHHQVKTQGSFIVNHFYSNSISSMTLEDGNIMLLLPSTALSRKSLFLPTPRLSCSMTFFFSNFFLKDLYIY